MPTGLTEAAGRVKEEMRVCGVATQHVCAGVSDGAGPPEYLLTCMTLRKSVPYNIRWL